MRKRIMKGLVSATLAALMLTGAVFGGLSASAAQIPQDLTGTQTEGTYEGFKWSLNSIGNEKYITIEGYDGRSKHAVIPDEINGIRVMEISSTFKDMKYLRSITVSKNIRLINRDFARNCDKLENIFVSPLNQDYSSVKGYLCDKAGKVLYRAPIGQSGTAYIPPDIEKIEMLAFENCKNITGVVTKSKVTYLGYHAFYGCEKLEEVLIRGNAETIEQSFEGCPELRSISLTGKQNKYITLDGVLYKADKDKNGKMIPVSLVRYPAGKKGAGGENGDITAPAEYTVPDTVKTIEQEAFADCTDLITVNIHKSLDTITLSAFDRSSVRTLNIDTKNKYYRFKKGLLIGKKTAAAGRTGDVIMRALPSLSGKSVVPETITEIYPEAFKGCGISSVMISKTVVSIGSYAFSDCVMLRKITIPSGVNEIQEGTFRGCTRLISVTYDADGSGSSKKIGYGAFQDCPNLVNVKLPRAVTEIDDDAFMGDTAVTIYGKTGSYALEFAQKHRIQSSVSAPELKVICIWATFPVQKYIGLEMDAAGGKSGYEYAVFYKKANSSRWVCARDYSTKRTAKVYPKTRSDYQIMIKVKDKVGKVAQRTINIEASSLCL